MNLKNNIINPKPIRMSGAGNLFLVIDNSENIYSYSKAQETVIDIHKNELKYDFTSEGIMFINKSDDFDFEVWFFNPDSSSGMMCGNGGRCAVRFAYEKKITHKQDDIIFKMAGEIYTANLNDEKISLYLPLPISIEEKSIMIGMDMKLDGLFIQNGTEHFCVNIEDVENYNLAEIGPIVRYSKDFQPKGTNYNIFQILEDDIVQMRTYERGVEAETGACGTGAIAVAFAAQKLNMDFPIRIIPTSGIAIDVDINKNRTKVILSGHAEIIDKDK